MLLLLLHLVKLLLLLLLLILLVLRQRLVRRNHSRRHSGLRLLPCHHSSKLVCLVAIHIGSAEHLKYTLEAFLVLLMSRRLGIGWRAVDWQLVELMGNLLLGVRGRRVRILGTKE